MGWWGWWVVRIRYTIWGPARVSKIHGIFSSTRFQHIVANLQTPRRTNSTYCNKLCYLLQTSYQTTCTSKYSCYTTGKEAPKIPKNAAEDMKVSKETCTVHMTCTKFFMEAKFNITTAGIIKEWHDRSNHHKYNPKQHTVHKVDEKGEATHVSTAPTNEHWSRLAAMLPPGSMEPEEKRGGKAYESYRTTTLYLKFVKYKRSPARQFPEYHGRSCSAHCLGTLFV